MNQFVPSARVPLPGRLQAHEVGSAVSAFMDEGVDELTLSAWLASETEADEVRSTWSTYHLIGDLLREQGAPSGAVSVPSVQASLAFAQRICAVARQADGLAAVDAAVTASVLAVQAPAPVNTASTRDTVANDAVFRWKLVAGLATATAVLGVAWGVGGGELNGTGAVLARSTNKPAVAAVTLVSQQGAPVWVNTPQGAVLRDSRLDELLQAHRRAGGASALQVPTGFLRSATYDASQR